MTSLGIVTALPAEARIIVERQVVAGGLSQPFEGTFLHICGLGGERALLAAQVLVEKGVDAMLSWGCAGGLNPDLLPGSLVLPRRVISPDHTTLDADATWHERLCRLLSGQVKFHTEPLAQTPKVLNNPEEKKTFSENYRAAAVDMESASVARVAAKAKLPFMAIRAVVDPFNETIPQSGLTAIDDLGRVQPLQLLSCLARRPREFFSLVRLGRHFRTARTTLATVVRLTNNNLFLP